MERTKIASLKMRGRGQRLFASVLAALVLAPVPALAITMLGSWTFKQLQSGGAPAALTQVGQTPGGADLLAIDMGSYAAAKGAKSKITATRDFTVDSGGETLSLSHGYETLLNNANFSVKIKIKPLFKGGSKPKFLPLRFFSKKNVPVLAGSETDTPISLLGGNYRITITISYKKSKTGSWDNNTPRPGSPHTFIFTAL